MHNENAIKILGEPGNVAAPRSSAMPLPMFASIGVFALIMTMGLAYGFQYLFTQQEAAHVAYFRWATLPYLAIILVLSWLAFFNWPATGKLPRFHTLLGPLFMGISFAATTFFFSADIRPVPWPIASAVVFSIGWLAHYRWGPKACNMVFFGAALLVYGALIIRVPHTSGANMLAIIEAASREFFSGNNPYRMYESIAKQPFGYLPGLWLPYSIFVSLGVDVRLFNLICLVLLVLVFEKGLSLGNTKAHTLSVTLYPFLLSPPIAQMIQHGHVWPYWLFLTTTLTMLYNKRYLAAALLLGLTLATRQTSLLFMGPLVVYLLMELGLSKSARYAAVTIATYLAIMLPFSLWTGGKFWSITYLTLSSAAGEMFLVLPQLSAAGWLQEMGLEHTLKFWQPFVLLFWVAVIFARKRHPFEQFLYVAGIAYLWLVFFNPYVVRYVYLPGVFMIAMAVSIYLSKWQYSGERIDDAKRAAMHFH